MKKRTKLLALILMVVMVGVLFAGCGSNSSSSSGSSKGDDSSAASETTETGEAKEGADVAFIITADDANGINDKGWIAKTWEGVSRFCENHDMTCTWYRPSDNSTQGYLNSMTTAINGGATTVVALGYQPVEAVQQAQYDFPDVKFISVEGSGIESDLADNTYAIFHQVDEAGFLAGYTAVRSGYKDIGIVNGLDIPPMNIWVWGYIQGMNYAAGELGIEGVTVRHTYTGVIATDPSIQTLASSWYADGREILLPMIAGGNNSLFAAATAAEKPCYGADVDQSAESDMIQTCPVKNIDVTTEAALESTLDGTWAGGSYKWYTVDDQFDGVDAVGLATEHWKVPNFTVEEYEEFLADFKADKNGMRSGIITQDDAPSVDELWDQIEDKNIEFINIE